MRRPPSLGLIGEITAPPPRVRRAGPPRARARTGLPGVDPIHSPFMADSSTPPLIRARALTKRFGAFTAVDAIDFDVAPGESFGFLGPNGAGKTSTMRMIACV